MAKFDKLSKKEQKARDQQDKENSSTKNNNVELSSDLLDAFEFLYLKSKDCANFLNNYSPPPERLDPSQLDYIEGFDTLYKILKSHGNKLGRAVERARKYHSKI